MKISRNTYTAYSIGCAVVWAIILVAVGATANEKTKERIQTVANGWALGWMSASIARYVYPPPGNGWTCGRRSSTPPFDVSS